MIFFLLHDSYIYNYSYDEYIRTICGVVAHKSYQDFNILTTT